MALLEHWFSKKRVTEAGRVAEHERHAPAGHEEGDHASASRRRKRMERRELLYAVVRETMVRAGVLSASYSFKVLSLEPKGRQYIVMIDLAPDCALLPQQLSDIEKQVTREAMARHDIQVTAIYWRNNEQLKGVARAGGVSTRPVTSVPRFEPIGADEVAALRQALAVGMGGPSATGFADTEVIVAKTPYPALSTTQYGDLT